MCTICTGQAPVQVSSLSQCHHMRSSAREFVRKGEHTRISSAVCCHAHRFSAVNIRWQNCLRRERRGRRLWQQPQQFSWLRSVVTRYMIMVPKVPYRWGFFLFRFVRMRFCKTGSFMRIPTNQHHHHLYHHHHHHRYSARAAAAPAAGHLIPSRPTDTIACFHIPCTARACRNTRAAAAVCRSDTTHAPLRHASVQTYQLANKRANGRAK